MKTYTELMEIPDYIGRVEYLETHSNIGDETFGWSRYLNQALYRSYEWRKFRRDIIIRDEGCDLALPGYELADNDIVIHHINPISPEQVQARDPLIFSRDNVICVSDRTHRFIHYGGVQTAIFSTLQRTPYDTCPWKKPKGGDR